MRALALLVFCLLLVSPVRAEDGPDAQAVISAQLEAFAHDDAEAAYDFAAPPIRERFADAAGFLAMVKASYKPVYRHRSVQFAGNTVKGDEMRQGVVFVDSDNEVWNGVYFLTRQTDGSWKIKGCALRRSSETSL